MKKLFVVVILLLSLLIPSVTFANGGPSYPKDGGLTCERVWISITNDGSTNFEVTYGFIYAPYPTNLVVSATHGTIVAPGETYELSWTPPQGFSDSVYAALYLKDMGSPFKVERHFVWGDLECHDYELVSDQRNECEGNNYYRITLTDYGQFVPPTLFLSGFFTWSDPFVLESRTFGPFDLGEHGTFPAVTLDEPEICQAVHELAFVHTKDCVGWSYGYVLDGVETIIASGEWVDQLEQEKIFVSFEVFIPEGEIASRRLTFGPWYLVEPADCYSTCDVTNPVVLDPVWGEWTPWVYNPANGLEESTRVGTQTTLFMDGVDGEFICGTEIEELSGYQTREVEYSLTVVGIGDCFTWEYVPAFTKGGEMSVVGELEGAWMDIYGPEIAPVPTVSVIWPSGYSLTVTPDAIAKDDACIQCETTRQYPMATYHDPAAPPGYWQGPFGVGSGVCSVIHPKGQVPSVGRATTICSLCPDQYEGGYIYQVNHRFYDGWVYKTTCYGREPYYTYMGYNWDAYVRIGEYTTDGERCSPRVQGCADWIHENME